MTELNNEPTLPARIDTKNLFKFFILKQNEYTWS